MAAGHRVNKKQNKSQPLALTALTVDWFGV